VRSLGALRRPRDDNVEAADVGDRQLLRQKQGHECGYEKRDTEKHKVNHAPENEFEDRGKPILPVNLSDRDL
jgi:hypothetical protein